MCWLCLLHGTQRWRHAADDGMQAAGLERKPSMHARACACSQDVHDLNLLTSWHDQLYAAVCFSVINSVEKVRVHVHAHAHSMLA
jgi:hypothetical protein